MILQAEQFYSEQNYQKAEEICLQVLEQSAENLRAVRLQALIMLKTNRIKQGVEFLKIALAQAPNDPESNIVMGHYSMALQKFPEAVNAFLRAYQADPKNKEALLYLADLHAIQKDWNKTIVFYALYINLDDSNAFLNQLYVNTLPKCTFEQFSEAQRGAMEKVLIDKRIDPKKMLTHWIQITLNSPEYQDLTQAINNKKYDLDTLQHLINSPLFAKGIERLRQKIPFMENFLTNIRSIFLTQTVADTITLKDHKNFLFAFSMQSWTNEYVFFQDENETHDLNKLKQNIESKIKEKNANQSDVISLIYLYACYDNPLNIEGSSVYLQNTDTKNDEDLKHFIKIQITNAIEEAEIKKSIPQLTEIDDEISALVQKMYEESPYPRGTEPVLVDSQLIHHEKSNILFAGCGTGFQILGFSQQHPNSTFTAIDLSSSSLAYAIRQTKQLLNLSDQQIRYGQGDILKLDQLPDRYDQIFCTGVLHHMEQPEKGLAVLKKILNKDGQMRLAFYSETARKEVVEARNYVQENGYKNTTKDIKRFRHDIFKLTENPNYPKFINVLLKIPDFYTLSECRDLVFHVQEHRYSIPQLMEILDRHDLDFISFNIKNSGVKEDFVKMFPDPNDFKDPIKWHEYEQSHPHAFVEMYDFNVRHKK